MVTQALCATSSVLLVSLLETEHKLLTHHKVWRMSADISGQNRTLRARRKLLKVLDELYGLSLTFLFLVLKV